MFTWLINLILSNIAMDKLSEISAYFLCGVKKLNKFCNDTRFVFVEFKVCQW